MKYYIADCHFGHDKVRILDGRKFEDSVQMDEAMITAWNETVQKKKDEVFILGDLALYKGEQVNELLSRLNGKKYLITGNHDSRFIRDKKFDSSLFEWIKPYAEIKDNGRKVVLCHYPIICYNGQYHGKKSVYMLYGHVHNSKDYENVSMFVKQSRETVIEDCNMPENKEGRIRSLSCNLINCFTVFSDYHPLTLDEWISKAEI
ncbi:MAG: metallophosphoesterase family protein [Lachnospiraceae bacterium]|nr:metallophosphoesterase family protein [Lachnospiraceae bacterium]